MDIVGALVVVVLTSGLAAVLIGRILAGANARAEDEAIISERLAQYAGANRGG